MSKRKKPRMPSLSFLDKAIYCFLLLTVALSGLSLSMITHFSRSSIAFANDQVLAVAEGASSLLILIPSFLLFCICLIVWDMGFVEKRPIFGKKGIEYGRKTRNIYPLFGKQRKAKKLGTKETPKNIRYTMICIGVPAFLLALSIAMYALAIYSRYELTNTSIIKYNCLNRISYEYPLSTADSVESKAYFHSRRRSGGDYTFSYTILFKNGKDFQFTYSEFRDLESVKKIDSILQGVPKQISGTQNLQKVRKKYDFNEHDWEIVQDLFEQNQVKKD